MRLTLPLLIVLIYMVAMLLVGYFTNKLAIKSSTDYMIAGRRMGVLMIAASLSANNIGGGSTMGVATRAFGIWGMSAAWYVLAASVAMIPLAWFAPKIRKTMAVTIPEVVTRRFGDVAGTLTALLNIVALFFLTASQVLASGTVVSVLTGIPMNVSILISGLVIIVYTTMGGMIADQISDLVQFFVILGGLAVALPFIVSGAGGWQAISAKLPPVKLDFFAVGWVTILGLIFNYFCTFLSGPEMVSRFSSAKDERSAQKASVLAALLMALMAFIPTVIGLVSYAMDPALDGGKGTSALMFATTHYAPVWVTGLIAASIVAATMSSADSNLLCASTMLVRDLYMKYVKKEVPDRKVIFLTRCCNVFICLLSMGIALFQINIVTLNLFAFALRSAGPFAAYAFGLSVPKASRHSGLVSILVGSIAVVYWQIAHANHPVLPIVFGCLVGTAAFFLTTFLERGNVAPSAYEAKDE
ncbi:putative sodium-solute symporter [Clostridiaceae bacterium JG1575]|nr:putative sodium-solute symporter [Clostridiaceae bacterium JG1575]